MSVQVYYFQSKITNLFVHFYISDKFTEIHMLRCVPILFALVATIFRGKISVAVLQSVLPPVGKTPFHHVLPSSDHTLYTNCSLDLCNGKTV